jgi:signal peptidase I
MQEKKRKPFIAGLFSVINPGLGCLYNGNLTKGIAITICCVVLEFIFWFFGAHKIFLFAVIAELTLWGIWIYFIVYNAFQARKIGHIQLKAFNRWYVYLLYCLVPIVLSFFMDANSSTQSYSMPTVSMSPAIEAGEKITVDFEYYKHHGINPGDVLIFRYPKNPKELFLKRCIAISGDTVEIRKGLAYVNNHLSLPSLLLKRMSSTIESPDFKDDHIYPQDAGNIDFYGPVVVPSGNIFVLGDTRDNSLDSRYFGFVNNSEVIGKAIYIWWSSEVSRIGKTVQ